MRSSFRVQGWGVFGVGLLALFAAGCDQDALGLTPPFLTASAETIDFGERTVGSIEERTVFVINKGQVPLTLEVPTGDTLNGVFGILVDSYTVQPNKDVVIALAFRPADPFTYTTTITINNNSTNRPELFLTLKGQGVRAGPCDGVVCRTSPPPTCVSETTTRRYEPIGTCEEGRCVHPYQDNECQYGCDDATGACRPDPCVGMSCTTPPNNCYFANGTCENGACRFDVNNAGVCDDGQACTTGDYCAEGTCVGTPTTCTTPPANLCVDANTRRVFNPTGNCNAASGACEYQSQDQFCQFGCTPDGCVGDPCAGIVCNTPPNGQCYNATGTCSNGVCSYTTVAGNCDDGDPCTLADSCNNGTCAGTAMVCNTPPAPDCVASNERRVYNATGTCSQGQCLYGSSSVICNDNNQCTTGDRCESGACVTSGALSCNDGNACTADSCDPIAGCVYNATSGNACTTNSADCPAGTCSGGSCLPTPNVTCVTEIELDLCQDVEVAGICSGSGECVVSQAPPGLTCPGCNGICIQCFIQICIPF